MARIDAHDHARDPDQDRVPDRCQTDDRDPDSDTGDGSEIDTTVTDARVRDFERARTFK